MKIITKFLILTTIFPLTFSSSPNFPIAKPDCTDRCGDIPIPFPFGTIENCYMNTSFFVTCNESFSPPKLFVQDTTIEIIQINLTGQLRILRYIAKNCYSRNGTMISINRPDIVLPISLTINNTANMFTILGCDTYGFVAGLRGERDYSTGCTTTCAGVDDLTDGLCGGSGCCQSSLPRDVRSFQLQLNSIYNYSRVWNFNDCGFGFVVEEDAFRFSRENISNLKNVEMLPMVVDWAIGNESCESARMSGASYACRGPNSECYKPTNGFGYRCKCKNGYEGSPYLDNGCQDIDECKDPRLNDCDKKCLNTQGGYECHCPKGYHGDGIGPRGCIPGESLVFKLVAGIAVGIIIVLMMSCWLYLNLTRRRSKKMKQKYFLQNGGMLLLKKIANRETLFDCFKIFSSADLEKATKNFHNNMIIGQGGFGVVYKGFLSDNRLVAIKKPRQVDPTQVEQFINEVAILTQISHRNVVKLLGCCLETQVPLLVYEFISNGTLHEHIHNSAKKCFIDWKLRLRIAVETADVLSYLHSAASNQIIHRDVKSANILLDHDFRAKVSDFGASRLVPMDQTQLSTMVQGTFGYLDPEYLIMNQLTQKSDVYSFGVVLVELITGMKALSFDRAEEDRNLANLFLRRLNERRLFEVVDESIVCDENQEQLVEVAMLARACLKVRGEDRPSMREVAMGLEGVRMGTRKNSWSKMEDEAEDTESLYNKRSNRFTSFDGYSTSIRCDSQMDYTG